MHSNLNQAWHWSPREIVLLKMTPRLTGCRVQMPKQTVGSTVAALRGRVQQMGGSEARAWPGPGRRSSQYKGVSWSEASAKWRAQCWDGSKVRSPAHILRSWHVWHVERVN